MTIEPNGSGMWCVYADAPCQELIAIFSDKADAEQYVKDKGVSNNFLLSSPEILDELADRLNETPEDWD